MVFESHITFRMPKGIVQTDSVLQMTASEIWIRKWIWKKQQQTNTKKQSQKCQKQNNNSNNNKETNKQTKITHTIKHNEIYFKSNVFKTYS